MEDIVTFVNEAKNDTSKLDNLIEEFLPFIKKCVARVKKTKQSQDDALSLAMLTFTDCVKTYKPEKGEFKAYVHTSIRNRLINDYKNERKHSENNVPIYQIQDAGSFAQVNKLSIDAYHVKMEREALRLEIEEVVQILAAWNTSLGELSLICPKQRRTRVKCEHVAALILKNDKWRDGLLLRKRMHKSDICQMCGVSDKFLEKFRKYIFTLCLVQSGDYPILRAFLPMNYKGGVKE